MQGGALRTEVTAGDPYLHTSQGLAFDIEGNDFQYIEVRMKLSGGSAGAEFFWANTVEGLDQGFVAGKERGFRCTPDGEWHTYFVYPLWRGKVSGLRLDLPDGEGTKVELDYIRIIQGQRGEHDPKSPVWDFTQGNGAWLAMSGGTHLTSGAAGTETTLLADGVTLVSPALDLKTDDYQGRLPGIADLGQARGRAVLVGHQRRQLPRLQCGAVRGPRGSVHHDAAACGRPHVGGRPQATEPAA